METIRGREDEGREVERIMDQGDSAHREAEASGDSYLHGRSFDVDGRYASPVDKQ
jgi:hypothetical protein